MVQIGRNSVMIGRMEYVNLGQSGLKVSRICLGMMTYAYRPHPVLGHG
jgi:hypothetical protein